MRVISAAPSPCVWRRSRRPTSQVPTNPTPSTSSAEMPISSKSLRSCLSIEAMVMPTDTIATTRSLPSGANTGTTARIDGPRVPVACSVNTLPSGAPPTLPMNFLPMLSGSGWL